MAFFTLLESRNFSLKDVGMSQVAFNDGTMIFLALSLYRNHSLRKLDLSHNRSVSSVGWGAKAAVLHTPCCILKGLNLSANSLNEVSMISLANTLVFNTRLRALI